jgi:hypothetical protein
MATNDRPSRYYHGGIPGLRPGDLIHPMPDGHRRRHDGCAICQARNTGQHTPLDAAPAHPDRVYITTDRLYARFYASLAGRGDLYTVRPVGDVEPSAEDRFPTWTCPAAEVVAVYDRAVTLTTSQRRQLVRAWIVADHHADGTYDAWQALSPADQRREFEQQWALLWRQATSLTRRNR